MDRPRIIDGDGHVFEDMAAIGRHMPALYRREGPTALPLFPALDHLHTPLGKTLPGAFGGGRFIGPDKWMEFLEDVGIETAVLYPTFALSYGRIVDIDYAISLARAYNNWLHEAYVARSPRFRGIALIPLQEPEAAVGELRRAVLELGMTGAMLPSTGLKAHLGSKEYWPVYAEAERLGCCLAFHGGSHNGLGFDDMNTFAPAHALGHPFGIMIGFAGIVYNGIFDRYPHLRIGWLEAGVSWFQFCLERFDGSHRAFTPFDPSGRLLQLRDGEKVSDYVLRYVRSGNIFIGCEGDEPDLPYLVKRFGNQSFIFSSDYPHEVTNETCKEEIEEILESRELSRDDKEAILYRNAERFYSLKVPVA